MAGNKKGPVRVKKDDQVDFKCGCGAEDYPVKVGELDGLGEVRQAVAMVRGKDGIVREYEGIMVFMFNGQCHWVVYPDFGDEVEEFDHKHEPPEV